MSDTEVAPAHEAPTPQPTYAPAAMALGIMMLLWGVTTMWIMSAAGLGVMAWALWMWISDIRLDWKKENRGE